MQAQLILTQDFPEVIGYKTCDKFSQSKVICEYLFFIVFISYGNEKIHLLKSAAKKSRSEINFNLTAPVPTFSGEAQRTAKIYFVK